MKPVVLAAFTLALSSCQAQTSEPLIILSQPTAAEVEQYEVAHGSVILAEGSISYGITSDPCPPAARFTLAQPVQAERPEGERPFTKVYHYFAESDSTVWCSTYDWKDETPSVEVLASPEYKARMLSGEWPEPINVPEALAFYDPTFSAIAADVTEQIGQPQSLDAEPVPMDEYDGYTRNGRWETPEAVVTLEMEVSENAKRIKSYVYWVP